MTDKKIVVENIFQVTPATKNDTDNNGDVIGMKINKDGSLTIKKINYIELNKKIPENGYYWCSVENIKKGIDYDK